MKTSPEGRWGHPHQRCRAQEALLTETGGEPLRCHLVETGGGLSLTVLWDRCMDIAHLSYRGISIPFLSPNGLGGRMADGFERSFCGGMLYTCGLGNAGPASQGHPMHGRVHFAAATERGVRCGEHTMELSGEMREAALFGQQWRLQRRLALPIAKAASCFTTGLPTCPAKPSP